MLALLSIPSLLMFFQLYSVQKYFAINKELFSKDLLLLAVMLSFSSVPHVLDMLKVCLFSEDVLP